MELNEFIKEVISNIYKGLDDAKTSLGVDILPSGEPSNDLPHVVKYTKVDNSHTIGKRVFVSNLKFKVALTDEVKDGKSKKLGVFFSAASVGAKLNNELTSSSTTSVEFSVPILLPK